MGTNGKNLQNEGIFLEKNAKTAARKQPTRRAKNEQKTTNRVVSV